MKTSLHISASLGSWDDDRNIPNGGLLHSNVYAFSSYLDSAEIFRRCCPLKKHLFIHPSNSIVISSAQIRQLSYRNRHMSMAPFCWCSKGFKGDGMLAVKDMVMTNRSHIRNKSLPTWEELVISIGNSTASASGIFRNPMAPCSEGSHRRTRELKIKCVWRLVQFLV